MSAFDLHLYFRGPLSSCNYDCHYCPFAKHKSSREELAADRLAVARFVDWCEQQRERRLSILFTPWGEGLIRAWYREALLRLAELDHVVAVAIQTNLSMNLDWLAARTGERARAGLLPESVRERLGLWTTWHPGEVELERFAAKSDELVALGIRHSVGVVGLREHLDAIERLRSRLDPSVYLWINAYKSSGPGYYEAGQTRRLAEIDPLFEMNTLRHESRGHACAAGQDSLLVRGDGSLARCHFVDQTIGNLYTDDLDDVLAERPCPQATCGCFIGYAHLHRLGLRERLGSGLAARLLSS